MILPLRSGRQESKIKRWRLLTNGLAGLWLEIDKELNAVDKLEPAVKLCWDILPSGAVLGSH